MIYCEIAGNIQRFSGVDYCSVVVIFVLIRKRLERQFRELWRHSRRIIFQEGTWNPQRHLNGGVKLQRVVIRSYMQISDILYWGEGGGLQILCDSRGFHGILWFDYFVKVWMWIGLTFVRLIQSNGRLINCENVVTECSRPREIKGTRLGNWRKYFLQVCRNPTALEWP